MLADRRRFHCRVCHDCQLSAPTKMASPEPDVGSILMTHIDIMARPNTHKIYNIIGYDGQRFFNCPTDVA